MLSIGNARANFQRLSSVAMEIGFLCDGILVFVAEFSIPGSAVAMRFRISAGILI